MEHGVGGRTPTSGGDPALPRPLPEGSGRRPPPLGVDVGPPRRRTTRRGWPGTRPAGRPRPPDRRGRACGTRRVRRTGRRRRQVGEQRGVEIATGERRRPVARVDARQRRPEAVGEYGAGQRRGVGWRPPGRKQWLDPGAGELPLAVGTHVLQEQVAERERGCGRSPGPSRRAPASAPRTRRSGTATGVTRATAAGDGVGLGPDQFGPHPRARRHDRTPRSASSPGRRSPPRRAGGGRASPTPNPSPGSTTAVPSASCRDRPAGQLVARQPARRRDTGREWVQARVECVRQ